MLIRLNTNMISTKPISVCFWGNSEFFRRTQNLREKIKAEPDFKLEETVTGDRMRDSAMFISSPKLNSNRMEGGFVKVVYAPGNYREHLDPFLLDEDREIYYGGTVISIFRYTLEKDLWNVIQEFNR